MSGPMQVSLSALSYKRRSTTMPDIRPEDCVVLVLGMTGSGKSTFINACTQNPGVIIGHGWRSETELTAPFSYRNTEGQTMWLLDTPGFDDTSRNLTQILVDITLVLDIVRSSHARLAGVVFLFNILSTRVGYVTKQVIDMLKAFVGERDDQLERLVLVSTFWDMVKDEDVKGMERKEKEFLTDQDFWLPFMVADSRVVRLEGKVMSSQRTESTRAVLQPFFAKSPIVFDIQHDWVTTGGNLGQTRAGQVLDRHNAVIRAEHSAEMAKIRAEKAALLAEGQITMARLKEKQETELQKLQTSADADLARLVASHQELMAERDGNIAALQSKILDKEAELRAEVSGLSDLQAIIEKTRAELAQLEANFSQSEAENVRLAQLDAQRPYEIERARVEERLRQQELRAEQEAERIARDAWMQQVYRNQMNGQQGSTGTISSLAPLVLPMILMVALTGTTGIGS